MSATPELEPVFIIVERAKIRGTPVMENAACCLVWCATLYNTSDVLRGSPVMESENDYHLLPGLQLTYGLCW